MGEIHFFPDSETMKTIHYFELLILSEPDNNVTPKFSSFQYQIRPFGPFLPPNKIFSAFPPQIRFRLVAESTFFSYFARVILYLKHNSPYITA